MSILQENLNYFPALYVVFQILPQIFPQLQSNRHLLTTGIDPFVTFFFVDDLVRRHRAKMPAWMYGQGGV